MFQVVVHLIFPVRIVEHGSLSRGYVILTSHSNPTVIYVIYCGQFQELISGCHLVVATTAYTLVKCTLKMFRLKIWIFTF